MHISQSTSHTSPCTGFLNRNHGVKVGKGCSSFEDNRTSRLRNLFQEHPMAFPPSLSSSNSTMMSLYPWWQHQGRATRGWSWWSAAQVPDCPRHGVSETLKYCTNVERLFSFTLLQKLHVCSSLMAPNNAELSQKTLPAQQAGQNQEIPWPRHYWWHHWVIRKT